VGIQKDTSETFGEGAATPSTTPANFHFRLMTYNLLADQLAHEHKVRIAHTCKQLGHAFRRLS
jgi:mRNA deadenylase 3'-5' endonuclease subunit Ccr4